MSVCAILLSYKRPQNIERIIKNLIATPGIKHVVLSNNNPDINLSKWINLQQYPIKFIQQSNHSICVKRFEIALDLPYDYFIFPDDDLFLSPQQLQTLLELAQQDKSRVHGMFGQIKSFNDKGFGLFSGVHGATCEVEILNRVYCFSREHLLKMVELTKQLNMKSISDALHIDDLLISFSGQGRPICHDLGAFEDCPTSLEVGIATCAEDGFDTIRLNTFRHLTDITARL
jgi:hypothetical protein